MSDTDHLLIPFASCDSPGCAEARRGLELPALERLLARLAPSGADEAEDTTLSMPHERVLAGEFGISAADGCIPWAAWHVAHGGGDPQGAAWAWITPCHWDVGRDHVAMSAPGQLALSEGESRAFLDTLRPWFEQDAIELEYEGPTRWLAHGEVFRGFASASLDRVAGRVIDRWMPRGEMGKAVRRLQQEMQMLLYTHAANEERSRGGKPTVNSFWVSGTGALPGPPTPAPRNGPRLADGLREAAWAQDWPAWASAWRQLDSQECAGLLDALHRGEQVALTLCGERNARTFAGTGGGFFGKLRASLGARRAARVLDSL